MKKLLTLILSLALLAQSTPASALTYTVKRGDTLSAISRLSGFSVRELAQANGIADPDRIYVGQTIDLDPALGAAIPTVVADYDDTLASRITSSASSLTLTRGTVPGTGTALSGLYGFRIDDEYMTATCVSTACTIVARGLDPVDGGTEVTALKAEHRRGAVVKISNFPQLALISRMLNGQESIPGNIYSSSTTYIPPSAAAFASKYYVDSVGAGGFTSANVSSTLGLQAITSGIPNCSTAAACVGLNVSSTGGVYVDSGGKVAFSGTVNTSTVHNGATSFVGSATATGQFSVSTAPTDPNSVVNKSYSDQQLTYLTATGTAGNTIAIGNLLALSPTTSRLIVADSSGTSTAWTYVGVALSAASAGSQVSYARPGGIVGGLSGLTPGAEYFLSTGGAAAATAGTIPVSVGRAYSTSTMFLSDPSFKAVATGPSTTCDGSGIDTISLGFNPNKVSFHYKRSTNESSFGDWWLLPSGASTTRWLGSTQTAPYFGSGAGDGKIGQVIVSGPATWSLQMMTVSGGFTVLCNQNTGGDTVNYVAEYSR